MNSRERGFLLLTSRLGNPERPVLTVPQMRGLSQRVASAQRIDKLRDLEEQDLVDLGYDRAFSRRIIALLSEERQLEHYLSRGTQAGCTPITRVTPGYPLAVRKRLGMDSPGCLWAKGDLSILENPCISVVGSRDLLPENRDFTALLGETAAKKSITVVSGNARGADRTVQQACLDAGGSVVSVVADNLASHEVQPGMLYLSEEAFNESFTTQRALSRNRVIHTIGTAVFVTQCGLERGGTWNGTTKNLKNGWSPVFCYNDGSEAVCRLLQMGAGLVDSDDLSNLETLHLRYTLFDME